MKASEIKIGERYVSFSTTSDEFRGYTSHRGGKISIPILKHGYRFEVVEDRGGGTWGISAGTSADVIPIHSRSINMLESEYDRLREIATTWNEAAEAQEEKERAVRAAKFRAEEAEAERIRAARAAETKAGVEKLREQLTEITTALGLEDGDLEVGSMFGNPSYYYAKFSPEVATKLLSMLKASSR